MRNSVFLSDELHARLKSLKEQGNFKSFDELIRSILKMDTFKEPTHFQKFMGFKKRDL
jgi:Arc/MetJ-type ribon-helix-helix transcriptional regulator